jgi:putative addiction module killer protein
VISVKVYIDAEGRRPFVAWRDRLSGPARAKIEAQVARMELGNLGDVRPVGAGLSECRIHFGPGYRIYFGRDGKSVVILLAGGTKKRQQRDIETAKALWQEHQRRKRD